MIYEKKMLKVPKNEKKKPLPRKSQVKRLSDAVSYLLPPILNLISMQSIGCGDREGDG